MGGLGGFGGGTRDGGGSRPSGDGGSGSGGYGRDLGGGPLPRPGPDTRSPKDPSEAAIRRGEDRPRRTDRHRQNVGEAEPTGSGTVAAASSERSGAAAGRGDDPGWVELEGSVDPDLFAELRTWLLSQSPAHLQVRYRPAGGDWTGLVPESGR